MIRLGGFHTLMITIGSIFHTMRGYGIDEALIQIFGPNAIVHILSGKAIARALLVLYVLDACLSTNLLELIISACMVHCEKSDDDDDVINDTLQSSLTTKDVQALQKLLSDVFNSDAETLRDDIVSSETLGLLNKCIDELKIALSSQSRTAKLLLNYI